MSRLARARDAVSARVSHFLATPRWRRTKQLADGILLAAVMAAIGWAAINGIFVAQRAAANRAQALLHLDGAPLVRPAGLIGKATANFAPPTVALDGMRTARVSIGIANDGADGVTVKGGTLTGPFLAGSVRLATNSRTGYVEGNGTALLTGTVTVNCDAALPVTRALVMGRQSPGQQDTRVAVSVKDANGTTHATTLTVDSTAIAIQGRVCTR